MTDKLTQQIQQLSLKYGFNHFGISPLKRSDHFQHYQDWITQKKHADMLYLETSLDAKKHPHTFWRPFNTCISFSFNYFHHPKQDAQVFKSLNIAKYAQGEDYHFWIKEKLNHIILDLKILFPNDEFESMTDSKPLLERSHGYESKLGWIGKNTCLIHPQKGSFFLLGEILTTISNVNQQENHENYFESTQNPLPDFCGHCTRCIEACPTQALKPNKILDSNLCISYLTIESRKLPPEVIRDKISDLFFGCDICQDVCPWNVKIHPELRKRNEQKSIVSEELISDLKMILTLSGKKIEKLVRKTPLSRAGSFGLRRNALIVIGNLKLVELKSEVEHWTRDKKLTELALWCLQKLES